MRTTPFVLLCLNAAAMTVAGCWIGTAAVIGAIERARTTPPVSVPVTAPPAVRGTAGDRQPTPARTFTTCASLRKVHPSGVPSGHPAYLPRLDRDRDGRACEPTSRKGTP